MVHLVASMGGATQPDRVLGTPPYQQGHCLCNQQQGAWDESLETVSPFESNPLEGVMNSNVRNLLVLRDCFLNYLIDKMTASSTFPKTLVYGPFKALVAQQVHNTL
jgi:hypothetical protein